MFSASIPNSPIPAHQQYYIFRLGDPTCGIGGEHHIPRCMLMVLGNSTVKKEQFFDFSLKFEPSKNTLVLLQKVTS